MQAVIIRLHEIELVSEQVMASLSYVDMPVEKRDIVTQLNGMVNEIVENVGSLEDLNIDDLLEYVTDMADDVGPAPVRVDHSDLRLYNPELYLLYTILSESKRHPSLPMLRRLLKIKILDPYGDILIHYK